ncbi:hypothetical protein LO771_06735 [Streptacidiphilus sp. ASG 303]|uniref:hypothetical protein n=1 Tax=Streptacidiphilus sp. ASG 303 TaxID=2896847 RepID=UPI001E469A2C|nr:hypothetical protein [Streptacidiphilus sp. ASG 303]MCD0482120.1 hypothetical protein [Streptacidiphilus sp. ASG 303]
MAAAAAALWAGTAGTAPAADGAGDLFAFRDPRITESSGLAASALHPGVVWTHNDSDDGGRVFAVDGRTGRTLATVTLAGVAPRDAEAVSLGRDDRGRPALYLADIGDNLGGRWPEVWIYRFAEPAGPLHDTTVRAVRYTVRYADGPRNAEALMVHPRTGRVYIASKQGSGGGLYAGPRRLSTSGVNVFRRIADVPSTVTDGAFSPDGTRLVLRGYFSADAYRWRNGAPQPLGPVDVPLQRQGEGVTFTPDGRALLYGSEGRGTSVWRQPLTGAALPDSARPAGSPSPARSGAPAGSAGPRSGPSDGPSGAPAGAGTLTGRTAAVLAGAGAVALAAAGLRRRARTRGRGRGRG